MATAAAQDGHLNGTTACPTVDYSPIIGSSLGRFYLPLHGLLGSVTFCYVLAAMLTGAGILGAIALESAAVRSVAIKATTLVPGADAPRPDFLICFTKVIDCRWADPAHRRSGGGRRQVRTGFRNPGDYVQDGRASHP